MCEKWCDSIPRIHYTVVRQQIVCHASVVLVELLIQVRAEKRWKKLRCEVQWYAGGVGRGVMQCALYGILA